MSAETTTTAAAATSKRRPPMRGRNKILLSIFSLVLMAVLRTGFMFIIIAMLPSIVTYYIDQSRKRYTYKTIFACNLAGVMPFIGKMLQYGPSSSIMENIMGDGMNWFIVYGSALIGLLMVRMAPMIAHTLIVGFHNTQIQRIARNQKRIEREWGPEVTQFSKAEDQDDADNWMNV